MAEVVISRADLVAAMKAAPTQGPSDAGAPSMASLTAADINGLMADALTLEG